MSKEKLPSGLKRHIRKEKARIRREVLNVKKQEELIEGLYKKFFKNKTKSEK